MGLIITLRKRRPAPTVTVNPAQLPWNAGAKRYWWRFGDDPVWTGTSGGGVQATALGDAVASFQSGSVSDTYWLNQAGGTSGILRANAVELPYLSHFEGNIGSQDDSVAGGFTFGFCGYVSGATFSIGQLCAGGQDFSPRDHALIINPSVIQLAAWTWLDHTTGGGFDWSVPHRVIGVGEYVGGSITGRLYIDGVLSATQAGLTAGSWSRDLLYSSTNVASGVWNVRSRFVAAQAFTSPSHIALIDGYLSA